MKNVFLLLAFSLSIQAGDWPRWRGASGDGVWNPEKVPADFAAQQPQELWQADIGGGYGGVTVSDGRVYVLDRPKEPADIERILCYAAEGGKHLWSHQWPAVYGRMEYGTGPRSSVTVHEGRAYVLGAAGMAMCLEAASGKVVWQVDTVKDHGAIVPTWGFAASPVLDEKRVLLHVGAQPDGSVIALDQATGKPVWQGGPDPAGYSTPEIITHEGTRQIIAWGPEHIQSLNPETGATLWTYPYKITYGVSIAQPLYRDGILLVSGYWHGTKALRPDAQPTLLWENEKDMCGLMSSPLYKDGTVYLLDKKTGLQAIELATGKILWSDDNTLTPKDRNPQMSLVWLRESVGLAALLNASGELVYVRLKPDGFEELARHQIIGKTWAHPAFVGNRIYARSDTSLVAWRLWPD
ncbi:PQQ-binding-like beta-propeller repeat protein [Prosthecobacter sp. SYSU 5D2]|uniref:PQQ-binding-like beta-propeller repeat protein n=1 Tax=Prosthecobacter sp. SYSU 5D2 TaxID=3134134 RepID=UPI0031FE7DCD